MPSSALSCLTTATLFASQISAHGHVTGIIANGKYYMGYTPNIQYMNPVPKLPAWSAGGYGQGGIVADQYANPPIICHDNAKPGAAYAQVKAGTSIEIQWTPWAFSHHGPIISYLAPCPNNNCLTAPPTSLRFTKFTESGLLSGGTPEKQIWATDKLIKENSTLSVLIPENLKSGNYVLRNEIIALHTAGTVGGAQNYPQCFSIEVTGGGMRGLEGGVAGTKLYLPVENGIVFNIARVLDVGAYRIPGPPVVKI